MTRTDGRTGRGSMVGSGSENDVWVSDIFHRTAVTRYELICEMFDIEEGGDLGPIASLSNDMRAGADVEPERFPAVMQSNSSKQDRKKLPPMFKASFLPAVSADVAEVLRNHSIGRTQLFPVELLKKNGDRHDGDFFFLNVREVKHGFDLERSVGIASQQYPDSDCKGMMPLVLKHDMVAVSADVLDGPDLWLDTTLFRSFFFKGPLAEELIARKLIPSTRMESSSIARCIVVPTDA